MTRTKDILMQMREEESFEERMGIEEEDFFISPIDINSIKPSLATSEQIANGIIQAIKEGRISPMEFAVKKKCIADGLELAFKDPEVKKMAVEEVERHGKSGATLYGASIKVTSKTEYDYSKDEKWKQLHESIAPVVKQMKEQEERIKSACKNNASLVNTETGEVIASIVPSPTTSTIAVSFKKK